MARPNGTETKTTIPTLAEAVALGLVSPYPTTGEDGVVRFHVLADLPEAIQDARIEKWALPIAPGVSQEILVVIPDDKE